MAKTERVQRFRWEREGDTVTVIDTAKDESREFSIRRLPPEIQAKLPAYGLSSLLADRTSQVAADDKLATMEAVFGQLAAGEWEGQRGGAGPTLAVEAEAIMLATGLSAPVAGRLWKEARETGREDAVRAKYAQYIAKVKESRGRKAVALDDLL